MSKFHLSAVFFLISAVALMASCTEQNSQVNSAPSANATNSSAATSSPASSTPIAKLNINTATGPELLAAIPNLGNRMLHEFEEYRPYRSIQQFRREIGKYVPQEKVAEYEQYIFVPINPNEADAQTLQQIPGLDATEAAALIGSRPYSSTDEFIGKLGDKVSAAEVEVAKTYVSAK